MHNSEIPQVYIDRMIRRSGRAYCTETLEGGKTALLVVDMQYFFMDDEFPAACPVARDIVPNINRLAEATRDAGGLVVWIQMHAPPESRQNWSAYLGRMTEENRASRLRDLAPGSKGFELWPDLNIRDGDEIIRKLRFSAFIQGSSNLEDILRARVMDTVIVTGVATNICCESTARDAMMLNFRTIMVADANAAATDAEHNATLAIIHTRFGDVRDTADVVTMLEASKKAAAAE